MPPPVFKPLTLLPLTTDRISSSRSNERIAPPSSSASPPVSVSPEIATSSGFALSPSLILKMRESCWASTVRRLAPSPWIETESTTPSSPNTSAIVAPSRLGEKVITLAPRLPLARPSASRSEKSPAL